MAHALSEQRFTSYRNTENWVDSWIGSKYKKFFRLGIRTLPKRCKKVVQNIGWWGCVCAGEAQEAARAVRAVHATLSAARDHPTTSPLINVPEEWLMMWWGPASPQHYVRELALRAHHAATRLQQPAGLPDDYFPQEIDLRSFLNPRRVLAAFRARTAARLLCTPDALDLCVKWDCATTNDDAVVVHGLRLSGAVWGQGLEPAPAHAPPHAPAPPLLLRYMQRDNKETTRDRTAVPVYASEARELLLLEVHAPPAPALRFRAITLNAVALFVAES
ncbi:Cytoplasmic dynein 2 heavy chain 1 [Eumeta japonica]|uniref:Cytoplasmic dynein 2 heavy chain 1 n=1 Tax=Eumeta variegata TaxID=151549 RepID=A0A4C1VAS5_EUMVA|nr:Cytoplasmic dynein 2 heavy chain 1 [Eumeta japonica]